MPDCPPPLRTTFSLDELSRKLFTHLSLAASSSEHKDDEKYVTDLSSCAHILADYEGKDYLSHAKFNKDVYSKIRLPQSTKYFDMYLICWKPYQETKIHDHPVGGCLMMVLQGELNELGGYAPHTPPVTTFSSSSLTSSSSISSPSSTSSSSSSLSTSSSSSSSSAGGYGAKSVEDMSPLMHHYQKNVQEGLITFRQGSGDIHKIKNGYGETISLHIYSPTGYKPNFF